MSDDKIKQVAQAIAKSYEGRHWDVETMAIAAIKAMREPTAEMLKASNRRNDDNDYEEAALANWQSMIDVALGKYK